MNACVSSERKLWRSRNCAHEQGIAEEDALKSDMEEKPKEFVETGAEVYAKM